MYARRETFARQIAVLVLILSINQFCFVLQIIFDIMIEREFEKGYY